MLIGQRRSSSRIFLIQTKDDSATACTEVLLQRAVALPALAMLADRY
jgi:hypothetical protein